MYPEYIIHCNDRYLLHPRNTWSSPQCQPVPENLIEPLLAHRILDPVMLVVRPTYATSALREELENAEVVLVVDLLAGMHKATAITFLASLSILALVAVGGQPRTSLRTRDFADEITVVE